MQRKNKNIILITVMLVFLSFSVILYQGLTSKEEINSNYNDSFSEVMGGNDYQFPSDNYNNSSITKISKQTRGSQIFTTVIMSILIIVSIQIAFFLVFSGFNYLTFHLTFFPLAKIGVYLILSLGLTGLILVNIIKPISFLPADSIVEKNPNDNNNDKDAKNLEGTEVTDKDINLNDYSTNISLTRGGTYNLTGEFTHTIIVNCNGDITLSLNNVNIKSQDMASIINIGSGKLKIETLDNTTNILSDAGSSNYDSVIYSTGPLELKGNGTLNIEGNQDIGINVSSNDFTLNSGKVFIKAKKYGIVTSDDGGLINILDGNLYIKSSLANLKSKQNIIIDGGTTYLIGTEEDSPIDTVNGYEINGGTLIALGKDIYETPITSSKNYTICLKLKDIIKKDSILSLMNSKKEEFLTFLAAEDASSIIISTKSLTKGTYSLLKDGKSSGTLENNIYKDGTFTEGVIVDKNIEVTSKITAKK